MRTVPIPAPLVATLLLSALLAGCMGAEAPAGPLNETTTAADAGAEPAFVNPDGRGVSAAANETNKTVVGKGGIEHLHDYWGGEASKVLLVRNVHLGYPYFCDNKDTNKVGCAVVRLPNTDPATLVYEGAGKLEVLVDKFAPNVQGLEMSYRNGADPTWRPSVLITPGTPFVIELRPIDTDMPHASASQWEWRFVGKPAAPFANVEEADFNLTITVHKSENVANWPGHPDFYADKAERVVMDKAGKSTVRSFIDWNLYGDDSDIIRPDLLVSSGTGNLTMYVNVTAVDSPPTNEVVGLFLLYTNATGDWYNDQEAGYENFLSAEEELENGKSYLFTLPVKHTGWDSPYAPVSGWQFKVRAYAGKGLGCDGCYPYEIEYHMKIIAYPDPQYAGGDALEA